MESGWAAHYERLDMTFEAMCQHLVQNQSTIGDTNQIMEQLIQRCQRNLDQYIWNELLMHNHCMEIVRFLNLAMLETMLPVDD